jgi:hypothetical protein
MNISKKQERIEKFGVFKKIVNCPICARKFYNLEDLFTHMESDRMHRIRKSYVGITKPKRKKTKIDFGLLSKSI